MFRASMTSAGFSEQWLVVSLFGHRDTGRPGEYVSVGLCATGSRWTTRGLLSTEAGAACHLPVHVSLQSDVAVQSVRGAPAGAGAVHAGLPGPATGPEGEPAALI